MTKTQFVKTAKPGVYKVDMISLKTGSKLRLTVTKSEVVNATARGGAYRTAWVGKFADTVVTGDTRIQAFQMLLDALERKGIRLTEKG